MVDERNVAVFEIGLHFMSLFAAVSHDGLLYGYKIYL